MGMADDWPKFLNIWDKTAIHVFNNAFNFQNHIFIEQIFVDHIHASHCPRAIKFNSEYKMNLVRRSCSIICGDDLYDLSII